jgi:hypothetical protein
MIKRPSFPGAPAELIARRRFDHRLMVVALVLAALVAAGMLARLTGPMTAPEVDPNSYLVGP